jgi:hypothetical protein
LAAISTRAAASQTVEQLMDQWLTQHMSLTLGPDAEIGIPDTGPNWDNAKFMWNRGNARAFGPTFNAALNNNFGTTPTGSAVAILDPWARFGEDPQVTAERTGLIMQSYGVDHAMQILESREPGWWQWGQGPGAQRDSNGLRGIDNQAVGLLEMFAVMGWADDPQEGTRTTPQDAGEKVARNTSIPLLRQAFVSAITGSARQTNPDANIAHYEEAVDFILDTIDNVMPRRNMSPEVHRRVLRGDPNDPSSRGAMDVFRDRIKIIRAGTPATKDAAGRVIEPGVPADPERAQAYVTSLSLIGTFIDGELAGGNGWLHGPGLRQNIRHMKMNNVMGEAARLHPGDDESSAAARRAYIAENSGRFQNPQDLELEKEDMAVAWGNEIHTWLTTGAALLEGQYLSPEMEEAMARNLGSILEGAWSSENIEAEQKFMHQGDPRGAIAAARAAYREVEEHLLTRGEYDQLTESELDLYERYMYGSTLQGAISKDDVDTIIENYVSEAEDLLANWKPVRDPETGMVTNLPTLEKPSLVALSGEYGRRLYHAASASILQGLEMKIQYRQPSAAEEAARTETLELGGVVPAGETGWRERRNLRTGYGQ